MEQHRLILIYGAGSGFGKSSLGVGLKDALISSGKKVEFLEEHDIAQIEPLKPYIKQVYAGNGDDAGTLLEGCGRLIEDLSQQTSTVFILDSLLPCWDWLASADSSQDSINSFTEVLCRLLAPLNPLLVFLEGDMEIALRRAIKERGEEWALNLADARTGERNVGSLIDYFQKLRRVSTCSLDIWTFKTLRVETVSQELADSLKKILDEL